MQGVTLRELEKNDLVPFLGDSGYDEALVLQSMERIRRHFQEKGHYRVTVNRTEERSPEVLRLAFEVVPGPRLVLDDVGFEGNASYGADRLRRLMTTSARRFLLPGSGRLVDEELSADLVEPALFLPPRGIRPVAGRPGPHRGEGRSSRSGRADRRRAAAGRSPAGPRGSRAARQRPLCARRCRSGTADPFIACCSNAASTRCVLCSRIAATATPWSPRRSSGARTICTATVHLRVFAGEQWVVDRTLLRGLRPDRPRRRAAVPRHRARRSGAPGGDSRAPAPPLQTGNLQPRRRARGAGCGGGRGARAPGRSRGGPVAVGPGGRRIRLGERRPRPVAALAGQPLRQGHRRSRSICSVARRTSTSG